MKIDFLGIPIDDYTMKETIYQINQFIKENKRISQASINAGKVVLMKKDQDLYNSVISSNIINADGQSVIWASHFLGKHLPERVAGCDLMQELVKLAYEKKYKCFFLGASDVVLKKMIDSYVLIYGSDLIAGYQNGYFSKNEEPSIAKQIADSGAQLLFVGINSPKKEYFLFENRELLQKINFTMGVGGSFDIIAGVTKRAPLWLQKIGLEWFYRFLQEPGRMWRRYLFGNAIFIYLVLKEKFKRARVKYLICH